MKNASDQIRRLYTKASVPNESTLCIVVELTGLPQGLPACRRLLFPLLHGDVCTQATSRYTQFVNLVSEFFGLLHRLAHKSSSKFFSSAKRELEIFYVFGGKASERAGALAGAYYRKREAKDFEKVYLL